jgi:DNA-binding transcriptional LysR family regulator
MESAVALSEELHFQRAARKVGISQPMLTKNIQDLETLLGGVLFARDRKNVMLNDAGRAYVQFARQSLLNSERAVQAARSAMQEMDVPLHIGRSPNCDPYLVSTLLSVQLPLFPRLKIDVRSRFSPDLVHEVLDGTLDLAIVTEPSESAQITKVQIAETQFYIGMSRRDPLALMPATTLQGMANRKWIIFERGTHPELCDSIFQMAERLHIIPASVQYVTTPQEAFPFVLEGGLAFLTKMGALLVARNGVTVRPLAEESLRLKTYFISRSDNESRVASELLRAFMRKLSGSKLESQLRLPITA